MFCVHIFFKPLGYIPRTARLFGNSVFNFFDMKLFSKAAVLFYTPASNGGELECSQITANMCYCPSF